VSKQPVTVDVSLTPQQAALAFWHMGSDGQADFYDELNRLAGGRLCFQAAHILAELRRRSRAPDASCMTGLDAYQTLHNHCDQLEQFIDDECQSAKRALAAMAHRAKSEIRIGATRPAPAADGEG
jgi:hypothetical protein